MGSKSNPAYCCIIDCESDALIRAYGLGEEGVAPFEDCTDVCIDHVYDLPAGSTLHRLYPNGEAGEAAFAVVVDDVMRNLDGSPVE